MSAQSSAAGDTSLSLALAVIASSTAPLLLIDGNDLKIIAASASFCRAFQIDPATVAGLSLRQLGAGEWDVPQVTSLLRATATGYAQVDSYETDLCRDGHTASRSWLGHARCVCGSGMK